MPPRSQPILQKKKSEKAAERDNSQAVKESRQRLLAAFDVFDLDQDGFIEEDELINVLVRPGGSALSKDDAKDFLSCFRSCDRNGDGKLSIDEFATALSCVKDIQKHRTANKAKTDEAAARFKKQMQECAEFA